MSKSNEKNTEELSSFQNFIVYFIAFSLTLAILGVGFHFALKGIEANLRKQYPERFESAEIEEAQIEFLKDEVPNVTNISKQSGNRYQNKSAATTPYLVTEEDEVYYIFVDNKQNIDDTFDYEIKELATEITKK